MACDRNRASNLSDLREIFFWSIIISLLVSVLLSYFFSRMAIEPISRIISGIKATNSSQLSKRLEAGNSNDEIGQLVLSFNEMLHNLEKAFKNQQEFISNASHEMRTPLAVMIAESDYIVSRPRTPSEYENHIKEVIRDLKGLNSLLYNLLELAQLNQVTPMKLTEVRIDEVLYQSVHQVNKLHQGRKIVVKALYSDNEHDLLVNGNPGLLEIAFRNLLENACKFSTEEVIVEITMKAERIHIQILDKGIGIPSREIEKIFDPFSRATNVRLKAGFGIGLSIVHTIIKLHSGEINVTSSENIGTRFELIFNKIS
jgi:signal transduction histidine kinase